jgi:hypothetical protein
MSKIAHENYTGKFMNNHFEGYGIFTVKYELLKKAMDNSPKIANEDLGDVDFYISPREKALLENRVSLNNMPEAPL